MAEDTTSGHSLNALPREDDPNQERKPAMKACQSNEDEAVKGIGCPDRENASPSKGGASSSGESSKCSGSIDSRKNEPVNFRGAQLAGQSETAQIPPKIATSLGEAESPPPPGEPDPETAETEYDIERNFLVEPEEEPEMSTMGFTRYRCPLCKFISFYKGHVIEHMVEESHLANHMISERGPLHSLWKRNLMSNVKRNNN